MIRRRTPFKAAAAAAIILAAGGLAACSSGGGGNSASSNSPIVVCSDEALAGPYAQIGETDNWGSEAYFKHVNATGGILGHKVTYISLNNQSSAAESELDARKCIQTYHAQFIVGPESGADTESALPIAIANKTILISLSSGWQSNGYPASELNSWGFPGFYDVFAEDQIASVQNLIVPRHYTRVALLEDNCGSVCLANQAHRADPRQAGRLPARLHPDRPGGRDRRHPAGARHAGRQAADHPLRPGAGHRLDHRDPRHQGAEPDDPDQRMLGLRAAELHLGGRRPVGDAEHLRARLHAGLADRRRAGHVGLRRRPPRPASRRTWPA